MCTAVHFRFLRELSTIHSVSKECHKIKQVQGLESQTSSHGVASFVGQRHNTMRWPPAKCYFAKDASELRQCVNLKKTMAAE